jgi:hypothetical protein
VLLLVAQALAGPPLPQVAGEGFAVTIAVAASEATDTLVDAECAEGGNCSALRHRGGWGGTLGLQVTPLFGTWLHLGTEVVTVEQAEFTGDGFAGDGGAFLNLRPQAAVGALAWAGGVYGYAESKGGSSARRWGIRAGGAARFGVPDDQFVAWVGAELAVNGNDLFSLQQDQVMLPVTAPVPANLVAGFTLLGESMAGPGTQAPRLFVATDGSFGAETAVRVSLGTSF